MTTEIKAIVKRMRGYTAWGNRQDMNRAFEIAREHGITAQPNCESCNEQVRDLLLTLIGEQPLGKRAQDITYNQRMKICNGCEHNRKGWCGNAIFGKWIEHEGERVKLCGCRMSVKARFVRLHCPVKKW